MNYPLISEYVESILNAEDNFKELTHLRPVLNADGTPFMTGGNFAQIFKMQDADTGKLYAVKCFLREQERREESYQRICEELAQVDSPYLVKVHYYEKELYVHTTASDETEFPVLLMDWVEGVSLDKYLRDNIDDVFELELLTWNFKQLAVWLLEQPFAHGDLKPDNIIVREDGSLVLVDYDGMYVPAMQGENARELGSPDFRHPNRTESDFDKHIDDFPIASILLSLKAIALKPELLDEYGAKDRLLFSEADYRDLANCRFVKENFPSKSPELDMLYALFLLVWREMKQTAKTVSSIMDAAVNQPEPIEEEEYSTTVTKEDLANAWIDEYGAKYSADKKRLLRGPCGINDYSILKGTKVIGDRAFYINSSLTSVYIPDTVISIGFEAFLGCRALTSIYIPDSVTSIRRWAFQACSRLTSIHISNSLTGISLSTFQHCNALTFIKIPDSVISIEKEAFSWCDALTSITIPESVTSIEDSAFSSCYKLSSIVVDDNNKYYDSRNNCNAIIKKESNTLIVGCCSTVIPDSVIRIGDSAFKGCNALTSIKIPDSVTCIGDSAFVWCWKLPSIKIPDSVTYIGNSVFEGCYALTSIVVDDNNKYYDSRNNCNAIIKKESNTLIMGCRSTVIPDSVTCIGDSAFKGCKALTSIQIPDSVISIEKEAFSWCKALTSIKIPESVTNIGDSAFTWCEALTSIVVDDNNKYYDSRNNCNAIIKKESNTLIVGCCSSVIPDSVTSIGDSAFRNCSKLTSIKIPDNVTCIGRSAFSGCDALTSIQIPDSVTCIGDFAFSWCRKLTSIIIPVGTRNKFERLLPWGMRKLLEEQ